MTQSVQILKNGHEMALTVAGLLSIDECQALIEKSEARGFEAAPITTARGFQMRPDIRNNTRDMYDDDALARLLWQRMHVHVPWAWPPPWVAAGLNERFRIYRYEPGQTFRWHFDGAFERTANESSKFTVLVYLNDDFTGGTTDFHDGPSVVPVRGMALVFAHSQLHQGAAPTRGHKYVLRTDIMYRRASAGWWDVADEIERQGARRR
jgi:predicted 2-oxoglutarate/Fe(II)-dependent dioxygenase YbiX